MASAESTPWFIKPTLVAASLSLLGAFLCEASCIIPDKNIDVVAQPENEHSVRILEQIGLSPEAHCACDPDCNPEEEIDESTVCPLIEDPGVEHFFDPSRNFCDCSSRGVVDPNSESGLRFYVEDQDKDDQIFFALLLNYEQGEDPSDYVAYANQDYYNPNFPIPPLIVSFSDEVLLRPTLHLRTFVVQGPDNLVDLCGDEKILSPGWNTLTVLVTDRPWFRDIREIPNGESSTETVPFVHVGVPDIAQGASYDMSHHAFFCGDPDDPDSNCDCSPQEG